jgi:sortase A
MGQAFATLIVPRFGKNYERTVAESVDVKKVLNDPSTGVGHYSSTARLGEVGNFALAGHRTTFGAPFGQVDRLRVGDRIYLETKEGWFVYRFRNIEYVNPSQSDVLNDMPRETVEAKDRILTMTSCHPKLSEAERIIAYSIYESFVPRKNGVPSEIMDMRNR